MVRFLFHPHGSLYAHPLLVYEPVFVFLFIVSAAGVLGCSSSATPADVDTYTERIHDQMVVDTVLDATEAGADLLGVTDSTNTSADTVVTPGTDSSACDPLFLPLPPVPQIPLGEIDWSIQRFVLTDFPTHCLVVEDLDLDGALDLLWGEVVAGQPVVRIHFGPITRETAVDSGFVVPLHRFGPAASCTVLDVDLDQDQDVVIGSADGELGWLLSTGTRSWDFSPRAGEFPDDLSGTRLLITLPIDLDGRPPMELLVGGSPPVLIPCTGLSVDPGGGRDVQIFSDIPETGWLRCMAQGADGLYRVTSSGVCPPFSDGLWLGAAKGDINDDGQPDLVTVRDFGVNQMFTFGPSGGLSMVGDDPFRFLYNHGMGIHVADITQDGLLDAVITDLGPDQVYVGHACRSPVESGYTTGIGLATDRTVSWGVTSGDLDRDGDVDLLTGVSIRLPDGGFLPDKLCYPDRWGVPQANLWSVQWLPGRFKPLWIPHDPRFVPSFWGASTVVADLDNDGDLDGVVSTEDSVRVLWNQIETSGGWLSFIVTGESRLPVADVDIQVTNPYQFGARRFVTHTTGYAGHAPLRAHIGLGPADGPWKVSIKAPGYHRSLMSNLTSGRVVKVSLIPE